MIQAPAALAPQKVLLVGGTYLYDDDPQAIPATLCSGLEENPVPGMRTMLLNNIESAR